MSKNILLATINEGTIRNLSTFSLYHTKKNVLDALYKKAEKSLLKAKQDITKVTGYKAFKPVYVADSEDSGFTVRTKAVYASNGIVNVPKNFLPDSDKYGMRDTLVTVEEINSRLDSFAGQYKARKKDIEKEYMEAIRNTIPEGMYEAYVYGLRAGSYNVSMKGKKAFHKYVEAMLKNMGFVNAEDEGAVRKFIASIEVYVGGRFKGRNDEGKRLVAMGELEFSKVVIEAIIERCLEKNVLTMTGQGYRKLTKAEVEARQEAKTA